MARKKEPKRRTARVPLSDEELIVRLEEKAPNVLRASIPEADFERTVEGLLEESPASEVRHFYCRQCGEYHLKNHPHRKPPST